MSGWTAPLPRVRLGVLMGQTPSPLTSFERLPDRIPLPSAQLPSMHFGSASLSLFGLEDDWAKHPPEPVQAWRFHLADVTVLSDSGVLSDGRTCVIEDTLDHAPADACGYRVEGNGSIRLPVAQNRLGGTWLSLLLGNNRNYFHFILMNIARLFALRPEDAASLSGILVPRCTSAWQQAWLQAAIAGVPGLDALPRRSLSPGESVSIEGLLLPWGATDARPYSHPNAAAFAAHLRPASSTLSASPFGVERLYIDRRASPDRPLKEEDRLISALSDYGFVPVKLETLEAAAQLETLKQARVIVSPHGAGLTNLLACEPGARVIEIMPHSLRNWCYRHLAAWRGLDYDCVLSRSAGSDPQTATVFPHRVAIDHVLSCL